MPEDEDGLETSEPLRELVGTADASALLEVAEDRIPVMVEEGLLTPVAGDGDLRFRRSEVLALRLLGG
jgi:hypothetical protein